MPLAWRLQVRSKFRGFGMFRYLDTHPVMEPGPTQHSFTEAFRWQHTTPELQSLKCFFVLLGQSQEIQMRGQHEEVDRKLEDKSLVLRFLNFLR